MNSKKNILLCSIILFLSPCFTGLAHATSIVNLDDVPHTITLEIAGKESTITLMPYERFQSNFYPIRLKRGDSPTPALKRHGDYALWEGGKIALQNDGRRVYRRY